MPSLGLPPTVMSPFWCDYRWGYCRYFFTMVNCHASLPIAVFYVQISHRFITPTNHLKNCWRVRLLGLKTTLFLVCHKLSISGLSFLWIPVHCLSHPTKCQLSARLYILTNHSQPRKASPSPCHIGFSRFALCISSHLLMFYWFWMFGYLRVCLCQFVPQDPQVSPDALLLCRPIHAFAPRSP